MRLSQKSRAEALAFLTAFVTLFVQLLVSRMVSAKLLNNYAFLVISLTMLGFAFSGVVLSCRLPWFLNNLEDAITTSAALFVLSTSGAATMFYHVDARAQLAFTLPHLILD